MQETRAGGNNAGVFYGLCEKLAGCICIDSPAIIK